MCSPGVLGQANQPEFMTHTCHWPECGKPVPPRLWGCKTHWFRLPRSIRYKINLTYVTGQEITKTPSKAYLAAAQAAQEWIREHGE